MAINIGITGENLCCGQLINSIKDASMLNLWADTNSDSCLCQGNKEITELSHISESWGLVPLDFYIEDSASNNFLETAIGGLCNKSRNSQSRRWLLMLIVCSQMDMPTVGLEKYAFTPILSSKMWGPDSICIDILQVLWFGGVNYCNVYFPS